ncbi:MAG: hypothetical protein RLZZ361_1011 [Cyanobacteriota bacterium]|jgi:hypothetical protein
MFLSEGIINNFIESIEEADLLQIESFDDETAYKYLSKLYKKAYGAPPSGAGIYLLRTKFNLGTEEFNRRFIPNTLGL